MQVEYWFDFSCPYAYLGSTQIEAIAARTSSELTWRPMLLGGVFGGAGEPPTMTASKLRHNAHDMHRWADCRDVPLAVPRQHPMRTVRALRALLSLPESQWPPVIHSLYRAYWIDGDDITDPDAIDRALARGGVSEPARQRARAANDDPAIKDELRARTQEAVRRGAFGAPTMFVDQRLFFGQDRLGMVEAALRGWQTEPGSGWSASGLGDPPAPAGRGARIELWYDISSPFSYLASTQLEALADRAGAQLIWRPMLLGGLFKLLGGADIPLLAFSENKRAYFGRDLHDWAGYWNAPFRFASPFPLRTVTTQRLLLLAGDRIGSLSHALFRAAWADNRDVGDEATLADILTEQAFDAADMLRRTQDPAVKQQLIAATTEAAEAGVFGAPTCIVDNGRGRFLFWGQDRLELVERCARGWSPSHETSSVT